MGSDSISLNKIDRSLNFINLWRDEIEHPEIAASRSVTVAAPNSNAEDRAYNAMELAQRILYNTDQLNLAVQKLMESANGNPDAAAIERQWLHNMPDGFTLAEAIVK